VALLTIYINKELQKALKKSKINRSEVASKALSAAVKREAIGNHKAQ